MLGRDLAYSLDAARFAREVLGFDADENQARCLRSCARRLLLCCCRQFGKSSTAAAAIVHEAVYSSKAVVVVSAPVGRQSKELGLKVEAFLGRCPDRVGGIVRRDDELGWALAGGSRIVFLPGKESNVRGVSGCTLLVIDEAARVPDALYRSLRPMLATTDGRTWLMSTPFGKRGFFFERSGDVAWERLVVPVSECARISPAFLEQERAELGAVWFSQEYECVFLDVSEGLFSHDLVMGAVDAELGPLVL